MSEQTTQSSSPLSIKDVSVQDTLKFFKTLSDEDKNYFVDNMGKANLDRVIRAARQEEKDKLYPDIEKKNNLIKDLQDKLGIAEEKINESTAATMNIDEQLKQRESALLKTFEDKEREFAERTSQFEKKIRDSELRAHRAEVLKDMKVPKHLEKYVTGDSEDAIKNAAEIAIQTYNEMRSGFEEEFKSSAPQTQTTQVVNEPSEAEKAPQPQAPANPLPAQTVDTTFVVPSPDVNASQSTNHEYSAQELQKMSPTEYAKVRESVQSQMKQRFEQQKYA